MKYLNKLEIEQLNQDAFIKQYINSTVFSYTQLTEFNCIIYEDNKFYLANCGLEPEGDYYTIISVEFTPLLIIDIVNMYEHLLSGVDMEWAQEVVEEIFTKFNIRNRLTEEVHIRAYNGGINK